MSSSNTVSAKDVNNAADLLRNIHKSLDDNYNEIQECLANINKATNMLVEDNGALAGAPHTENTFDKSSNTKIETIYQEEWVVNVENADSINAATKNVEGLKESIDVLEPTSAEIKEAALIIDGLISEINKTLSSTSSYYTGNEDYSLFEILQYYNSEKRTEEIFTRAGATVGVFGISMLEGVANLGENILDVGALFGCLVMTPFALFTGNTKELWKSGLDFTRKELVSDSFDNFYDTTGSDLKNNAYGFNTTRAIGNFAGEAVVLGGAGRVVSAAKNTEAIASSVSKIKNIEKIGDVSKQTYRTAKDFTSRYEQAAKKTDNVGEAIFKAGTATAADTAIDVATDGKVNNVMGKLEEGVTSSDNLNKAIKVGTEIAVDSSKTGAKEGTAAVINTKGEVLEDSTVENTVESGEKIVSSKMEKKGTQKVVETIGETIIEKGQKS